MGSSLELWYSPHLKGLFHFSPASLSRNSGSAGRARVISTPSLIPSPRVSELLGKGMELRKAKGPGLPLPVTAPDKENTCSPGDEGTMWVHVQQACVWASLTTLSACALGAWSTEGGAGGQDRGCAHVRSDVWVPIGRGGAGPEPRLPALRHSYSLMLTVRLAAFFSSCDTRACLALGAEKHPWEPSAKRGCPPAMVEVGPLSVGSRARLQFPRGRAPPRQGA